MTGDHADMLALLLAAASEGPAGTQAALETRTTDNQMTVFAVACYYGRAQCAKTLMAAGCDVNATDRCVGFGLRPRPALAPALLSLLTAPSCGKKTKGLW